MSNEPESTKQKPPVAKSEEAAPHKADAANWVKGKHTMDASQSPLPQTLNPEP